MTQTRTMMIVDKIYWIKAERTKSRNYRLHLVRKLNFLCFIFMENATGTPITLAKVELKLVIRLDCLPPLTRSHLSTDTSSSCNELISMFLTLREMF